MFRVCLTSGNQTRNRWDCGNHANGSGQLVLVLTDLPATGEPGGVKFVTTDPIVRPGKSPCSFLTGVEASDRVGRGIGHRRHRNQCRSQEGTREGQIVSVTRKVLDKVRASTEPAGVPHLQAPCCTRGVAIVKARINFPYIPHRAMFVPFFWYITSPYAQIRSGDPINSNLPASRKELRRSLSSDLLAAQRLTMTALRVKAASRALTGPLKVRKQKRGRYSGGFEEACRSFSASRGSRIPSKSSGSEAYQAASRSNGPNPASAANRASVGSEEPTPRPGA